jgi:hypothetical protein
MIQVSQTRPVVLKADSDTEYNILREYADFWKIPYELNTSIKGAPIFATDNATASDESRGSPLIISPNGTKEAERIGRIYGLRVSVKNSLISLPAGPGINVSVRTDVYEFSGPDAEPLLKSGNTQVLTKVRGDKVYLLSLNLVGEFSQRVYGGLEESPSWKFRMATRLPFSYSAIPRFLRERSFRRREGLAEMVHEKLAPVECLRTLFLASLVIASGPIPRIGFWRQGKSYALVVSHDVEGAYGLETGTAQLLEVERSLRIRSSWNLPSDRYPLSLHSLDKLKNSGEIGAHDTKHDGRLAFLNINEKTRRLKECKDRLEHLTGRQVRGFRAPLLQHSQQLTESASRAGFDYDSSCPSWEMLSPTSLRAHGVGTIFPFESNGILEIPVSLPQDHQLIRIAGQRPSAAVDLLLRLSSWIRGLAGPCVLLVHPDYEFGTPENQPEYRRLLEGFSKDPTCEIMTLGELSDWWRLRSRTHWRTGDDQPRLSTSAEIQEELRLELVTGYGSDGFITEPLS